MTDTNGHGTINEQARQIPVIEDVDIVVAGGGPGGIPAAIAAARRGCRVLLIEKYGFLGGLATGGLMGPLFGYAHYNHPDVMHLGGIPVEIVRNLQALNAAPQDDEIDWGSIRFYPEILKHVADRMVLDAGANLLLHSYVVDVAMKNGSIDAVIIESKSGRQAIKAKIFIDATGDGDVAFFAGCPYTKGRKADGKTQSMGTKFIIGGVNIKESDKYIEKSRELVKKAIDEKKIPAYHPFWGEISGQGITIRDNEITPTVTRCTGDGTNNRDLTTAEIIIRKDSMEIVDFYRKNVPGYENCYLQMTPPQMGVRETRQITGEYVLTADDVINNRKFPDTIARGNWFMDIHCPLGFYSSNSNLCSAKCTIKPDCIMKKKYSDQLYPELWQNDAGPETYYDIPYSCILPQKTDNLLVAGRCISADHGAMSSVRVIATCFALGEAAGAAAALSVHKSKSPKELEYEAVQNELKNSGVPL